MTTDERCPTCQRPFSTAKPRRVCANCGDVIRHQHKWRWRDDGRAEHRNCADPDSYTPPQEATTTHA